MTTIDDYNYARDPRNCKRDPERIYVYEDQPDGSQIERQIPTRWAVCPVCDGKGSHVNPSIDSGGLTGEDFADDPDFAESYRRGDYDQPCNPRGPDEFHNSSIEYFPCQVHHIRQWSCPRAWH